MESHSESIIKILPDFFLINGQPAEERKAKVVQRNSVSGFGIKFGFQVFIPIIEGTCHWCPNTSVWWFFDTKTHKFLWWEDDSPEEYLKNH